MLRTKEKEENTTVQPGKIKYRTLDRRKFRRKAPSSHPWRQYKLAQCKTES